jgi:hypothetical protein
MPAPTTEGLADQENVATGYRVPTKVPGAYIRQPEPKILLAMFTDVI